MNMASNTRKSNMVLGKTHPRTSKVLSGLKISDGPRPRRRARSFFHDVAHIMIPLALFAHLLITGTVVLVYTIYFSQKLPRLFIIGASIGFGVLLLLLVVVRVLLRHCQFQQSLHDESNEIPAAKPIYEDQTAAQELEAEPHFPYRMNTSVTRRLSELSAVSYERYNHQISTRDPYKRRRIHPNPSRPRSVLNRRNALVTVNLSPVAEVSQERSNSGPKAGEKPKIPPLPVLQRAIPVGTQELSRKDDASLNVVSPVSSLSFTFEPSPSGQAAISIITGDDDLKSNHTYEDDGNTFRAPTEHGDRGNTPEIHAQSGLPVSPRTPKPLCIRKATAGNFPVYPGTYSGSEPTPRRSLTVELPSEEHLPNFGNSSSTPVDSGTLSYKASQVGAVHGNPKIAQVKTRSTPQEGITRPSILQTQRAGPEKSSVAGQEWRRDQASNKPRTPLPVQNRKREGPFYGQSTQPGATRTSKPLWINTTPMAQLEQLTPEEVKYYNLPQRSSISKKAAEPVKEMEEKLPKKKSNLVVFSETEARREMAIRDDQVRQMAEEVNNREDKDRKMELLYEKATRLARELRQPHKGGRPSGNPIS